MSPREHLDFPSFLIKLSSFLSLPHPAIEDLESRFFFKRIPKYTEIISQCSEDETLYILHSGSISCELVLPSGNIMLKRIKEGQVFGNPFHYRNLPLRFTTQQESGILFIPQESMKKHFQKFPQTYKLISDYAYSLLHETYETIALLTEGDTEKRFKRLLGRMARQNGTYLSTGVRLELQYTQKELAAMIGARRETVSRLMSRLISDNIIKRKGKVIIIPKEWAKEKLC